MKNKILKSIVGVVILALFSQSCYQDVEPTRMEEYLNAPDYTPTWNDDFQDLENFEKMPDDGDVFFPYYYQITDKPGALVYRNSAGIKVEAYAGGWDQRFIRTGFEVNGDFEIEVKLHIVQGTGDAAWQKAGIIVGDIGSGVPNFWLSLENPVELNNGRVNRFLPGAATEWLNMDEGNFSVFDWQIIKAVRTGNTLMIYRNGNEILSYTDDLVLNINGKVGISAEALSAEYEYLMVNGVTDDFADLDDVAMGNWINLDQYNTVGGIPSVWTTTENGVNVVAADGWNHRLVTDNVITQGQNFTAEIKLKWNNSNSRYPKAGLLIGELGNDAPNLIFGFDNNVDTNEGHSVVKFIKGRPSGEWSNIIPSPYNISEWHTLRITRIDDSMYMYIDGIRTYFEKGAHISALQGKLGLIAEGCDADMEYLSYSAD